MATTITFKPTNATRTATVGAHQVYVKQFWSDQWTLVDDLHADRVVIAAAPSFSSAQLYWRYGRGKLPTSNQWATVDAQTDRLRWYVRIVLTSIAGATYEWIGTLEEDHDQLDGRLTLGATKIETGKQALVALGIERLLDHQPVRSSFWWDSFGNKKRESGRALTFNTKGPGGVAVANRYTVLHNGKWLFHGDPEGANTSSWTSRFIADYLLSHHAPADGAGNFRVPFRLVDNTGFLPYWDKPTLAPHGKTVWELLNALISRHRLLSFFVKVVAGQNGDEVELHPFSFADAKTDLGNGKFLEANTRQRILEFHEDPTARFPVVVTSHMDAVDQVIVQGAARTTTGTVADGDDTFTDAWPTALETSYRTAASGAGDYPASTEPAERARRNADARGADKFRDVFSRFTFDSAFFDDQKLGDGLGGGKNPAFPDDADATLAHIAPKAMIVMQPSTRLRERHDYSDGKIAAGTVTATGVGPFALLPPLVAAPLPEDATRYCDVSTIGLAADIEADPDETNRKWSADVDVARDGRSLVVRVSGQPQHVIAESIWTPLTPVEDHGEIDAALFFFGDFLYTVTLEEDRRCEGRYPAQLPGFDTLRRKWIDAGDHYRKDYVAPNTVVGIDPTDGSLITSTGGYLQDDSETLKNIARLAWQWYGKPRKAFSLTTGFLQPDLLIGDLVTQIGPSDALRTINSCVTEITIEIPRTSGGAAPQAPKVTYKTAFGELDPLAIIS